jgi:hypothetical protein
VSDHENYNASLENREDIRKLACGFHAERRNTPPSEDKAFQEVREAIRECLGYDIEIQVFHDVRELIVEFLAVCFSQGSIYSTFVSWVLGANREKVSIWEYGQKEIVRKITRKEHEKRIDAESSTCEERWRRKEKELGIPARKDGDALFAVLNDVAWLESRTGHCDEETHRLGNERVKAMRRENGESELDDIEKKLKVAALEARRRLQLKLQELQRQKVFSNARAKQMITRPTPCARTASRAHRGASRPTFTKSAEGGGTSDDGDSDSSDSDPPAPGARAHHPSSVTLYPQKSKLRYLNRRLPHCCWRMTEGRRVA